MKTMTRMGVLLAVVFGLAGLADADMVYTGYWSNASFESAVLSSNTSAFSTPETWSFTAGGASTCSMGNLQVEGVAITPHAGDQVVYFQPAQYATDRIQCQTLNVTAGMFYPGQTTGTLQVTSYFQRWGTGTAGAYMHVYKNSVKVEPTADGGASSTPDTDWQQLQWGGSDKAVAVGDQLAIILWGYSYAAQGSKQIIWDDTSFMITSIPEPGLVVLLLGGGGALTLTLTLRRRRLRRERERG